MTKKQGEIDLSKYVLPKGKKSKWNRGRHGWTCPKCGAVVEVGSQKQLVALKRKHKRECGKKTPFDRWLEGFVEGD